MHDSDLCIILACHQISPIKLLLWPIKVCTIQDIKCNHIMFTNAQYILTYPLCVYIMYHAIICCDTYRIKLSWNSFESNQLWKGVETVKWNHFNDFAKQLFRHLIKSQFWLSGRFFTVFFSILFNYYGSSLRSSVINTQNIHWGKMYSLNMDCRVFVAEMS